MSGLLGVRGLLLLWASACLCLPWLARGALVISGEQEAPQVKCAVKVMFYKESIQAFFFFACILWNKQTNFVFFRIAGHIGRCQSCAGI